MNPKFILPVLFALSLLFFGCDQESTQPSNDNPQLEPFLEVPAVEDIIMYEVNLRAYGEDSNFQGLINHLDAIKALQVNTLWLMPIHPIGEINSVNSPYSVQDYLDVNPEFGTFSDFSDLIDAAHAREMAVIIDWVANHTAWDNPWIDSTAWYTQDGNGNIVQPPGTNWQDVADLNYDNQNMRQDMIDAMSYWVTEGAVDGFRCDAVDMVPYDFWAQALDSLSARVDRDLILLAEGGREDHFSAGFQLNYGWDFYNTLKNVFINNGFAGNLFSTHFAEYSGLLPLSHKLRFITNHDESAWDAPPPVLFDGLNGSLASAVVTMYLGGVPLIYSTQEVGVQHTVPFFTVSDTDWDQNPELRRSEKRL